MSWLLASVEGFFDVSTLQLSSQLVSAASLPILLSLLFIAAPFGRHEEGASALWGMRLPPRLAWCAMELPNLLAVVFFVRGPRAGEPLNAVLLSLFVLHYVNRALIFPFRTRPSKSMPLFIFASSASWTLYNGIAMGLWFGHYAHYSPDWTADLRFIAGVLLFLGGLYINFQSDEKLRKLRQPGDTKYYIPKGGFFDYVTAANYFGETVEWFGFALASYSWVGLAFAIFTICNLLPRALKTHQWYKRKFPKYPKERKAFIPFLL